jgi:hypothetical protein
MPRAGHGWAEPVAAYRLLDNPAMGEPAMRSGHQHATLERIRTQDGVLWVQDTTLRDDGTTRPKQGRGTVQGKVREEHRLHPTAALTYARLNLGVLGLKRWPRPAQPVAQECHRNPRAAKERSRGLEGEPLACAVQQRCPDTLVVNIAEREGARHEWLLEARRRLPGERAECIIRAKCHRRIAQGKEPRDVWEDMQKTHAAGRLPPVEVVAVDAKEDRPPRGVEPVTCLVLTRLPVADFPSACTVVPWYRCRWAIARLCRGLTQGCQREP